MNGRPDPAPASCRACRSLVLAVPVQRSRPHYMMIDPTHAHQLRLVQAFPGLMQGGGGAHSGQDFASDRGFYHQCHGRIGK